MKKVLATILDLIFLLSSAILVVNAKELDHSPKCFNECAKGVLTKFMSDLSSSEDPLNIHSLEDYKKEMYQCLADKCGKEFSKTLVPGMFIDTLLYVAELNGKTILDDSNKPVYSKVFKKVVNDALREENLNNNFAFGLNELRL